MTNPEARDLETAEALLRENVHKRHEYGMWIARLANEIPSHSDPIEECESPGCIKYRAYLARPAAPAEGPELLRWALDDVLTAEAMLKPPCGEEGAAVALGNVRSAATYLRDYVAYLNALARVDAPATPAQTGLREALEAIANGGPYFWRGKQWGGAQFLAKAALADEHGAAGEEQSDRVRVALADTIHAHLKAAGDYYAANSEAIRFFLSEYKPRVSLAPQEGAQG